MLAAPSARLEPPPCHVPVEIHRVVDGDTITATINLPWGVTLRRRSVRLLGYDAWESSRVRRINGKPPSDAELAKGKAATKALAALLASSTGTWLQPGPRELDRYGRPLGWLTVDVDGERIKIADWMTAHNHARP